MKKIKSHISITLTLFVLFEFVDTDVNSSSSHEGRCGSDQGQLQNICVSKLIGSVINIVARDSLVTNT